MHPVKVSSDYFTKALFMVGSGVLAHILAGGGVVKPKLFLIFAVLISFALLLVRNIDLEGPQLALLILVVQSASHFLLGGADQTTELQMNLAHLTAGFLSYKLVRHFDLFWEFLQDLAAFIRIPFFAVFRIYSAPNVSPQSHELFIAKSLFIRSLQFRGPPKGKFL